MGPGDQLATELASQLNRLLDLPAAMRYRTPQEVTLDVGVGGSTASVGETRTIQDRAGDEKQ